MWKSMCKVAHFPWHFVCYNCLYIYGWYSYNCVHPKVCIILWNLPSLRRGRWKEYGLKGSVGLLLTIGSNINLVLIKSLVPWPGKATSLNPRGMRFKYDHVCENVLILPIWNIRDFCFSASFVRLQLNCWTVFERDGNTVRYTCVRVRMTESYLM